MKSIFKSIIFTGLFVCSFQIAFAQEPDKTVSITASGSGKTQDEAKQTALRSAIEQAFGAFISSKTEILNDQIVSDQIASIASGNIKSFNILNESQLPDSSWGVTLKALVSVSKLTSFVEAKGVAIEIKGGMFALNIKQQLLNEQGEIKAVSEMVGLLHEPMQISFDYIIKSSEPKSLDAESKNWEIPLIVTAITNKNIDFCANYCIKTLTALSLSPEEVSNYKVLNKMVFPVVINYKGVNKTFYLRKQGSINAINTLISNWKFYTRLFSVQSGIDELDFSIQLEMDKTDKNDNEQIHVFSYGYDRSDDRTTINFLTIGQKAGAFSFQDKRTLAQIEKMTGYTVQPRGVVSQFKHGGFVVYEKDGHGLVVALTDLPQMTWNDAVIFSKNLVLNGYSDWQLPTKEELNFIHNNLHAKKMGNFVNTYHSNFDWSSSATFGIRVGYHFSDIIGTNYSELKTITGYVRLVRRF